MKTQKQRAAARKKRDREDFEACMDKNDGICQMCQGAATQMHHGKRKHLDVRHDPRWHYAVCYDCHVFAHANVAEWIKFMEANPND